VVPKTLIFAKDDSHAEDIVEIVREEFGRGNEFCKKITYRAQEKSETLISEFRTSPVLRIAVTVDMISTGTDVKPLEVLIFMRDVKSQTYYEQMVGRGTRIISETDLQAVTGDAQRKTHFVLIDAIGVPETAKGTDVRPLERKPTVAFDNLLSMVAFGSRDPDTLTTLASRLSRLDRQIGERDRQAIRDASDGKDPSDLANALLDAVDPDKVRKHAAEENDTDSPTEAQIQEAASALAARACEPFDSPELRNTLTSLKKRSEQVIDTVSEDTVIYAGYDYDKARQIVTNFERFIEENRDELTALQIIYNRPYTERHLTLKVIRQLADALDDPPYLLDTEALWKAYERLESAKGRGASPQRLLTDVVSLVRFAMGKDELLEPYPAFVERRFQEWLARHDGAFTVEQVEWLRMIKDHIAASLTIEPEDFSYAPFSDRGGRLRASRLFGAELPKLFEALVLEVSEGDSSSAPTTQRAAPHRREDRGAVHKAGCGHPVSETNPGPAQELPPFCAEGCGRRGTQPRVARGSRG
jgi:type I restriction enzyme, R subunit